VTQLSIYDALYASPVVFAAGFIVTRVLTPKIIELHRKKGIVRPDAHKPGKPLVAHSGGVVLAIAFTLSIVVAFTLMGPAAYDLVVRLSAILLSGLICFLIGLYDDIKILGGKEKTLLTLLAIAPIIGLHMVYPDIIVLGRPVVPLIGRIRLTIIYWIILPLAVAGPANLVNMLDVYNGVTPGMMLVATAALAATSFILGSPLLLIFASALGGVLLSYYPYNAYPARIFNGDSGSLFLGALLGALAVVGRIEFLVMTLLLLHIINGIMILVSFGGFKEHREIGRRPVIVKDSLLVASRDPEAPWSLTRLILLIGGPAREYELSRLYILLETLPAALAVITAILMRWP